MKKQQKISKIIKVSVLSLLFAVTAVAVPAGIRAANFDSNADPDVIPMLNGFASLPQSTLDENDQKAIAINNGATPAERTAAEGFYQYPFSMTSLATLSYAGGVGNAYAAANSAGEVSLVNTLLAQGNYNSSNSSYLEPEWASSDNAKGVYQYPRPYCRLPQINPMDGSGCPNTYGYPSGHSKIAWNEGMGLAVMLPEVAPQILARTAEIANGRVIVGAHYPLDVMAGRAVATRMIAYRMHDDTWKAKFDAARTQLRAAIEAHCGMTVAACVSAQPPTISNQDSIVSERDRLTYGFTQIGASGQSFQAPDLSYELLAYAFPTKTQAEKETILTTTAIDSGYPLDTTGTGIGTASIGWTRLDLGKALTWTDPVIPMCTVPGKETLPASDPGCVADPANPTTLNFELPGVASGTGTIGFVLSGACTSAVSNQAVAATPSAIADKSVLLGAKFDVACSAPGQSAQVEVRLDKVYAQSKLTVYKQTGSEATDITSSTTISTQTVNGAQVSVVTYTLQDGGFGDEDATANSTIADPVFVTFSGTSADVSGGTPATPNTGYFIDGKNYVVVIVVGIAAALSVALLLRGKKVVTNKNI
ncbi:phosphatase PAP2 family protein [Patescibacteria group bacterium]|nr:phosphatase PAP2 family protein [Patescibacteria group bacterium]